MGTGPSCATVNFKGLALEDLTCFWLSVIGFKSPHPVLGELSTTSPLASAFTAPFLFPK